ncbi:MAG: HNH endonuclease [Veillonella sp.]|uniref:HNH endonuclease n=1 Tax=Veillonella sp. TaxID=1926307 RepID=UPI002900F2E2|nr:HNH endonuclease [Veillonella sp.]MDU2208074.1 HNH endonuclease [Veillonella sp.]MDU3705035.1 HNH endonuclease [Veillonella sp.]
MSHCYLCGVLLDKSNSSVEHIIPNALGGNLKSRQLLCKKCNSDIGHEADSELAKQLNFFANMLNIRRDRGEPQEFKIRDEVSGVVYRCLPGGKPKRIDPEIITNNNQIVIKAPDKKIARQLLNRFKKIYVDLDIEKVISESTKSREYINNWCGFKIAIGGAAAYKSVYKTALNFYIYSGGDINNICDIKQILFNENTVLDYVKPCYLNYELIGKDVDEVLHSILIYGDRKLGKLYCYIEYFNAIKYIVLLSDNYAGETINKSYIFDVLDRKEISISNIKTNWHHIVDGIFENLKLDSKQLEVSLENLLKVISDKQHNEHVNKLIDEAWNSTMNMFELSEGDIITEAVYDKLIEKTVDLLIPYLNGLIPKD